jgi:hypothetical protein
LYLDAAATTSAAPPLSWSGDTNTGIYRPAADTLALVTGGTDRLRISSAGTVNIRGTLVIGLGDATTSVSGNVLRGPSSAGTNIAGGDIEIQAGNGTGTGGSGNIVLKTADVGSTGSTANTLTQRLLITPKGGFSFGSGATDYGTAGQVLKSNGDAPPSFGSTITSATVQTPTTTSADFTGIPSTVKRITILISGISTSGTANPIVRIGSGSFESTSYSGTVGRQNSGGNNITAFTTGFLLTDANTAATLWYGAIRLTNISENIWVCDGVVSGSTGNASCVLSGSKSLSGVLDRVQLTTTGSDTFDAGSINIIYE